MERYGSYKDSGVKWLGEIPGHWEVKRLGSYFIERRCKVSDKDYAPLSVTKNGIFPQLENVAKTNDGDNRKLVKRNDFVINSRSDRKGSSGVSPLDGSVSLINIVLKPRNTIYPPYCNYLLKSFAFIEEFYRNGRGIVADLWTTRYDEMKIIKMAMPTLSEQTAIANYLDSVTSKIDEAISQQQKMIDLLNERKQIIIQNAVTKGLDPNAKMKDSGVEWIGEIPEDWDKITLKRLFKERVAGSWGEDENKNSQNTVCMRIADFDYAKLSFLNKSQYTIRSYQNKEIGKKKLKKGDLLIEKSGGGEKTPVGRVVLFDLDIKDAMYANFMEKLCVREIALPKYVNFLLSAFYAKGMVWPYIKATTGIQNLDITNLLSKEIVFIPNKITQNKIVDFLGDRTSKIDSSISQCNKMISLLQERKQIIINDVVTGKVKVV
ncbi:MAG: restriction endonuclease subunit S [Prevotella sp.]